MRTREQLINRTAEKLGILASGQTLSAEDTRIINDQIVPILSDLDVRGIYGFGSPDYIDDAPFEHLAGILANALAEDFGLVNDDTKRLYCERRLRELQPVALSGQAQQTEYY